RLVYGRDPVTTIDRVFPVLPASHSSVFSPAYFSAAQSARSLARSLLLRAQAYQKSYYDSSHRDVTFAVGDQVWLHIPTRRTGLATKLLPKFYGPFTILRCLGPVTHEIICPESHSRDIVHVARLKPYHASSV